jgi:hypothetical protein
LSSDQLGTINQKLGSIGLPPIDDATPEQIQECIEKNQAAGIPVIGSEYGQFLVMAASAACGSTLIAIPIPPVINAPIIANIFFILFHLIPTHCC